jgi:putative NADH-flavin reductase
MRITVVGAAGMAGSRVVAEAARRGHGVRGVFRGRRPTGLPAGLSDAVTAVRADADDADRMSGLFEDADAVVAATRPAPGREHTAVATTTALLDAAFKTGTRILVVGGAAPLRVPNQRSRLVLDSPYVPEQYRPLAAASAAQLAACRAHPADWTYLSPPALLEPGTRTGTYRRGTDTLLTTPDGGSYVSAEDLAVAVLDELEHPGADRHFTIGY